MKSATLDTLHQAPSPVLLVARSVWIEVRRRDEYVALVILMSIYIIFAAMARLVGIDNAESLCFLLNMGLLASATFAGVLTAITAARVIPSELERRSIHTLLAKPLARHELILGKYLGAAGIGWVSLLLFVAAALLLSGRLPEHQTLMALQAMALQLVALALLASMALLLSLLVPQAVAVLVSCALYFGGGLVSNVMLGASRERWFAPLAELTARYLPNFGQLSLFTRYTDGGAPLLWLDFAVLASNGLAFTLLFLLLSVRLFARRSL